MEELPDPVPARDLKIGDEIELYKGDPFEPMVRMPFHPSVWWTVVSIREGGIIGVRGIGAITHWERTIQAECVREVTKEELGLSVEQWQSMLRAAKLSEDSKAIRITEMKTFIDHHTLKVRREGGVPDLKLRYSA